MENYYMGNTLFNFISVRIEENEEEIGREGN